APARSRPARPAATAAGGGRRTHRRSAGSTARSRPAGWSTSCTRSSGRSINERRLDGAHQGAEVTALPAPERGGSAVRVSEAEREVVTAEVQAVLAVAQDADYRSDLAAA